MWCVQPGKTLARTAFQPGSASALPKHAFTSIRYTGGISLHNRLSLHNETGYSNCVSLVTEYRHSQYHNLFH